MDYFVKRGERSERRPLGLADEGTETCVVSGVEVIKRIPLSNVHESESRVRRERTMKLVSKISGLATHVRVHLLPQGEKFFLTPDWDLKTVDQCYCSHQDPLLTILPRDARATASIPPCTSPAWRKRAFPSRPAARKDDRQGSDGAPLSHPVVPDEGEGQDYPARSFDPCITRGFQNR